MQNIDPIYFITPIVVIGFSLGLVMYWHYRRSLSKWVLAYSAAAYFGAIILKYAVQLPTIKAIDSAFGADPVVLGLYYGIQTAVFEVGGAFLLAGIAYSRGKFKSKDASGFGLTLAFWENAIYLGIPVLIDYIIYYSVLSAPDSAAAQTLYPNLIKIAPSLFYGTSSALPLVGYAILERISSLLAHFSWGFLAVLAAVYRKRIYLVFALPIGFLIDFLVPFSQELGIGRFEFLIFIVGIIGLVAALLVTRRDLHRVTDTSMPVAGSSMPSPSGNSQSLAYVIFKRSAGYGRIYLILGIAVSVLVTAQLANTIHASSSLGGNASLIVGEIPALILPLGTVVGSMGALMVFVSDRTKGVYEYLIAYGINVSQIFWSIVVAAAGLVTIVLCISVSAVAAVLLLSGAGLPYTFVELLIFYVIPISYTGSMFMSMAGMIWSFLATRTTGLNSPVGIAPLLGLLPMIIVLFLANKVGSGNFLWLVGSVSLALLVMVGSMIGISSSKMDRERFLSNA